MEVMPRGFPRPRITVTGYKGLPTPYVSDGADSPGSLHTDRNEESARDFLCSLCGEQIEDGRCGIASGHPDFTEEEGGMQVSYDHGLTHPKCAMMTARLCPSFRDGMTTNRMAMWLVNAETARLLVRESIASMSPVSLDRFGARERVL